MGNGLLRDKGKTAGSTSYRSWMKKRSMFVYEYAGKYVAGVSLCICDEDTCCISYLAVEENYQNKGIGTALIKSVCDYAKDLNFKRALLREDV